MREIKFRGQAFGTCEWVYGSLRSRDDGGNFIETTDGAHCFPVLQESIGQFTGLNDKNGKEIYEGDIVHVIEWENLLMNEWSDDRNRFDLFMIDEIKGEKRREYTSSVFWDEGGFCVGSSPGDKDIPLCCLFGDMKRSSPIFEFEIIGNIYDNLRTMR